MTSTEPEEVQRKGQVIRDGHRGRKDLEQEVDQIASEAWDSRDLWCL